MSSALLSTTAGRTLARLVLALILLAAWEYQPSADLRFWMSGPVEIVSRLASWIIDGSLWGNVGATLLAMALGYSIGSAAGIALGLVFGLMPRLYRVLSPYISALYAMPKIALAPLFVIVLGIGLESKVALVALTVFFLVLNSTLDGVRNVDRDLGRALALMGATRLEVTRKVVLPATLPWIFTGMRIAVRYAFTNTLLAELIASNSGIGFMIEYYSGVFDATGTYAAILVLVIMSVGMTEALTQIESRLSHRGANA
ncbi:MAG TPA: ABC transporter permease [Acetobacteraceae bacterium]|nr:ABC transporter permease [Acetobacteraceae bacterium]